MNEDTEPGADIYSDLLNRLEDEDQTTDVQPAEEYEDDELVDDVADEVEPEVPAEEEDAPVDMSGMFASLAEQTGRPPTDEEFEAWNEQIAENPAKAMFAMQQRIMQQSMAQQRISGYQEQIAMAARPKLYQEFAPFFEQVRASSPGFQPKTQEEVEQIEMAAIAYACGNARTAAQKAKVDAKAAAAYGGISAAPKTPSAPLPPNQRPVSTARGSGARSNTPSRGSAGRDVLAALGYDPDLVGGL